MAGGCHHFHGKRRLSVFTENSHPLAGLFEK
jgi:hypothetical protein